MVDGVFASWIFKSPCISIINQGIWTSKFEPFPIISPFYPYPNKPNVIIVTDPMLIAKPPCWWYQDKMLLIHRPERMSVGIVNPKSHHKVLILIQIDIYYPLINVYMPNVYHVFWLPLHVCCFKIPVLLPVAYKNGATNQKTINITKYPPETLVASTVFDIIKWGFP